MPPPLRVGIAGLGFGLQTYVPVVERLAAAELCALANSGSNAARDIAPSLPSSPRIFPSGREMIEAGKIDCVIVATPPAVQAELVRHALGSGIAVLCEKPCGTTLGECAELATLAAESAFCAATGFEYRYEAGISGLIDLVRSGEIGSIKEISIIWRTRGGLNPHRRWSWRDDAARGGGVLNEFCTHVFDYLSLLAGAPMDRVKCSAQIIVSERPDKNDVCVTVLAPDDVDIECVSENGTSARIRVSNASSESSGHHIDVRGDLGSAQFDHQAPFTLGTASLTVENSKGRTTRNLPEYTSFDGLDSRCPAIAEMVSDFLRAVRNETRQQLAQIQDCLVARQCISAAELSAASGEWVRRQDTALDTRRHG